MPVIGVHPNNGLPTVEAAGQPRVLAALPGRPAYSNIPLWTASQPLIPRSEWQECSLRNFAIPILDQGQTSSCVGHACANAFRRAWLASGQTDHPFSPWFVYGMISGNQDNGAIVGDGINEMVNSGMALTGQLVDGDLPAHFWTQTQLLALSAVMQKAKRFRIKTVYHLQGAMIFDQIASALLRKFSVVSGIVVGRNFSDLDSEGVVPDMVQALGGHALHSCGMKWSARRNAFVLDTDNTWGIHWGLSGTCFLAENAFASNLMAPDALAIATEEIDPGDPVDANWPVAV